VRLWSPGAQTFRPRTTDRSRVRVSSPGTKGVNLARSSWRNLTASVRERTLTPGASKARWCTTALHGSPNSLRRFPACTKLADPVSNRLFSPAGEVKLMLLDVSFLTQGGNNRASECSSHPQGSSSDAGPPRGGPASAGCCAGDGCVIDDLQEVVAPLESGGSSWVAIEPAGPVAVHGSSPEC
jgi:hypothetical protein